MKFEINYGKNYGGKIGDHWHWKTIESENEEEARAIIFETYKADYIVSITQITA